MITTGEASSAATFCAKRVGICDEANSAFPRGSAFPAQVDRVGFRADWDALDDATRTLERNIVASTAPYKANYARLAPSLVNDEAEVETALRAVRELAGA